MIDPDVVAERPADAWSHGFLAKFLLDMAKTIGPGQSAQVRDLLCSYMTMAQRDYQGRQVGPRSFAPVLLLLKHALFVMEDGLEPRVQHHVLIVMGQAVQSEVVKGEDGLTDRACIAALHGTLFTPLMPTWRKTIDFCFQAYKSPLKRLVEESSSFAAWERAIQDVFPYLFLYRIAPIYDLQYGDRVRIDPEIYGRVPATYDNLLRTPRRFYSRAFSADEIRVHESESKVIDETFAHLFATIGLIMQLGDQYLAFQRAAVLETLAKEGRLAAKQKVLKLKAHSLSIPAFFADRLLEELSGQGSPDAVQW